MGPDPDISGMNLFAALFSDEPMPGVEAAIVMAHPGDEARECFVADGAPP